MESELCGALEALGNRRFDLVCTGIGALCWLPDIAAGPGGGGAATARRPAVHARGSPRSVGLRRPATRRLLALEYPYFETDGAHFSEASSYGDHDEPLESPDIVHFNHGLAEVISALLEAGMQLTAIEEHDTTPWNALMEAMSHVGGGEFRLFDRPERLPVTYRRQASKPTAP